MPRISENGSVSKSPADAEESTKRAFSDTTGADVCQTKKSFLRPDFFKIKNSGGQIHVEIMERPMKCSLKYRRSCGIRLNPPLVRALSCQGSRINGFNSIQQYCAGHSIQPLLRRHPLFQQLGSQNLLAHNYQRYERPGVHP